MDSALSTFEYRLIRHGSCHAEVINPYLVCGYGCRYCYCRETRQKARQEVLARRATGSGDRSTNFPRLLRANSRSQYAFIGTAVDPYPLWEPTRRVTRMLLTECSRLNRRVVIATKSPLVLRDDDLLQKCASSIVFVSIASLSGQWQKTLEPQAPAPQERLHAVKELSSRGIDVAVFVAPIFPTKNDEIETLRDLLRDVRMAGAKLCVIGLGLTSVSEDDRKRETTWKTRFLQQLMSLTPDAPVLPGQSNYIFEKLGTFGRSSLFFPDPTRGFAILGDNLTNVNES